MATRSGIQSRFGVRSLIACCILLCPVDGCDKSVKMPLASDASTSSASGTCSDYELNNEEEHVDCGGPNCMSCGALAKSCKALLQMNPGIASGVQMLDPDGNGPEPAYTTFCEMSADEGGWTLAMKLDGSKTTFAYDAPLWSNKNLLNAASVDLDNTEAKLNAYNVIPARALRVGMRYNNDLRWIVVPVGKLSTKTMFDIFANDYHVPTSLGRSAWVGLIAGADALDNCNNEGLNVKAPVSGRSSVRVGIVTNDQNDCLTPDAYIGFGAGPFPQVCPNDAYLGTTGVGLACFVPVVDLKAMGYVMVRE